MAIQFNPHSPLSAAVSPAQSAGTGSLSGLMMAPVSLTPLAPPSSGPTSAIPDASADIATTRRQAYFAAKQQALLGRLAQAELPAGALSTPQRDACIVVLKTVAAAVAAKLAE